MNNLFFHIVKLAALTCVFFCGANVPAWGGAEYVHIQDKYGEKKCSINYSHAELSSCLRKELELGDKKLNEVYLKVKHACGEEVPACTQELLSAQRAWITFRDASCKFESMQSYGGSAYGDYVTNCLIGYTRERTQYLEHFLDNP